MHRLDLKEIKWALFVGALAAVLIGCAGNSITGSGTVSAGGGTTATTAATFGEQFAAVNLPEAPGLLQYAFLTGAGRAGDQEVATVRGMEVSDLLGVESSDLTTRNLTLTSFQSQIISTNIGTRNNASRKFDNMNLNVFQYQFTDSVGTQTFNTITGLPAPVSVDVRVFNGRQTLVPIYMDPETINIDVINVGGIPTNFATFNDAYFDSLNRIPSDSVAIRSYLSDYVCFDISSVSGAKPVLKDGQTANRVFFSGDGYAMGAGDPSNGGPTGAPFELVLPDGQGASIIGRYSSPIVLPGGIATSVTPGSYTTLGIDPTDITTLDPILARKITSFQGVWKNHFLQRLNPNTGVIEDLGYFRRPHAFDAFSIPGSDDDDRQDVVFVTQTVTDNANGTKSVTVNSLFWGYIDMSTSELFLYPLNTITLAEGNALNTIPGQIQGSVGRRYTSTGAETTSFVRAKYVEFNLGASRPAGMPASGLIVVMRRD